MFRKFKRSKWVKIYSRDNEVCFFHPIHLKILLGDNESRELFKQFTWPKPINNFPPQRKELCELFIKYGFLILEDQSDDETFKRQRTTILQKYSNTNLLNKKLSGLRIILTEKCNLKCSYCYVRRDVKSFRDMDEKVLYKAIDLLVGMNKAGSVSIQLSGGEPFSRFKMIQQCVSYLENYILKGDIKGVHYAVETNGILVTEEISRYLSNHNFVVAVSLDGHEEVNDKHRLYHNGKGSFSDVVKGIKLLQKYDNKIHIDFTPTPSNISQISECYEYFIEELNCKDMTINTPQPGPKGWEICGRTLAQEAFKCREIAEEHGGYVESLADRVFAGIATSQPQILSCSTFTDSLVGAVSPDGKISYCIVSWNIKECTQPIEDFSNNSNFRMWKYNELYIKDDCIRCPAVNVCGGPCALESYYEKQTSIKDNQRCRFYRTLLEKAVWK